MAPKCVAALRRGEPAKLSTAGASASQQRHVLYRHRRLAASGVPQLGKAVLSAARQAAGARVQAEVGDGASVLLETPHEGHRGQGVRLERPGGQTGEELRAKKGLSALAAFQR
eukprot:scaffold1620_cov233-Pinguiococcus_pyrenoidosus.AAC.14